MGEKRKKVKKKRRDFRDVFAPVNSTCNALLLLSLSFLANTMRRDFLFLYSADVVVTFRVVPNPPLHAFIARAARLRRGYSQVPNVHTAQV